MAFDAQFFPALESAKVASLLQVHGRFTAANQLHATLFERRRGPNSIIAGLVAATSFEAPKVGEVYQAARRDIATLTGALLRRCEEAEPYIYDAIDRLEADLGVTGKPPAAEREYDTRSERVED